MLKNIITSKSHPILFAIMLSTPFCAYAQNAGNVIFKSGDATITHADNTVAQISKNDALNAGDTIETRNGRVQFTLIDGGKVSLQPNTIYKINRYEFSGKEDGSEYAFTELVKGGLRTVTGLIGHKNRERYQLHTPVATIGIRGTEFSATYDSKLTMTTNHGSVDVCNAGGCRNVITGQSVLVIDNAVQPQYTNQAAKVTSAPAPIIKPVFIQAEKLNEERVSETVTSGVSEMKATIVAAVTPTPVTTGTGTGTGTTQGTTTTVVAVDILAAGVAKNGTQTNVIALDGDFEKNGSGQLVKYSSTDGALKISTSLIEDFYSDSFVSMGRVKGKIGNLNLENMSYIVGDATQAAELSSLANLNAAVKYNVIASTTPMLISPSGNPIAEGNANTVTGNMSVNFATLAYSYNLIVPLKVVSVPVNYTITGSSNLIENSANFSSNANVSTNVLNVGCLTGCTGALTNANGSQATVVGRFIGSNAERAGLQYGINTLGNTLTGSVILGKQP